MELGLLIVVVVLVIALFVISYMKRKKYNSELGVMREELKVGDKVMTDTGVIGEVVESFVEDEFNYFVLKTGRGNNIGYFTVHANAIYYSFDKEKQNKETVTIKDKNATKQDAEIEKLQDDILNAETKIDGKKINETKSDNSTKKISASKSNSSKASSTKSSSSKSNSLKK